MEKANQSNNNYTSKWLKRGLLTIILGAIGSGIWDLFLSNFTNVLIKFFINLMSAVSTGYSDYIFRNVGDGIKHIFSYQMYALMMFIFITLPIFMTVRTIKRINKYQKDELSKMSEKEVEAKPKEVENSSGEVVKKPKPLRDKIIMIIVGTLGTFFMITVFVKHLYTYNAANYIEKSIDIVSPYISNQNRLHLLSEYRLVNTEKEFEILSDKLENLAIKHKIELPEFRLALK